MTKTKVDLFIALTDTCNLRCDYCVRNSWEYTMSVQDFELIINQVANNVDGRVDYINLWGGEPLMHPNFTAIMAVLQSSFRDTTFPLTLSINTNGILLSLRRGSILELIRSLPHIRFKIYISLDEIGTLGLNHRWLSDSQYQVILDNIFDFQEQTKFLKNLKISVSSVLSIDPVELDYFKEFVDFFQYRGIPAWFCLESDMDRWRSIISYEAKKSLIERCVYLKARSIKYVIEDINNINKTLRCTANGNIYNFLDPIFTGNDKFLISSWGNLSFLLHDEWKRSVDYRTVDVALYRSSEYIQIVNFLKRLNLQ